jgi:tRNA(fMet)-specific endonuclease VapC
VRLDVLLAVLTILPHDVWATRRFGQLKAQLEQAGEFIGNLDLQLASIALDREATLVTQNNKHFSRLTDLSGLILDDWLE